MSETLLDTTTGLVLFASGPGVRVTVYHFRNEFGEFYAARATWPGLDDILDAIGDSADLAVERLVARGLALTPDGKRCGLRCVLPPNDVNTFSSDPEDILATFPAMDAQGGTLFLKGDDRGVANFLDVDEADDLLRLVEAVPAILRALREARAERDTLRVECAALRVAVVDGVTS